MAKGSGKKMTRLEQMEQDIQGLRDKVKRLEATTSVETRLEVIENWLGKDWLNEGREPESRELFDEVSDFGIRLRKIEHELGIDPTEQDDEEDEEDVREESKKKQRDDSYEFYRYVITCEKARVNLYWREKQVSSSVKNHKAYWTSRIKEAKLYTSRNDAFDFMETDDCEHFSGQTNFRIIRIDLHSMEEA